MKNEEKLTGAGYQFPWMRQRQRDVASTWGTGRAPVIVLARQRVAPPEVIAARRAVCVTCEYLRSGGCRLFGCCDRSLNLKQTWLLAKCPANRWATHAVGASSES